MNKSMWKAMEYARDGMFVPSELTGQILDKVPNNGSVAVLFSYEMLPVLFERGYADVTLVTKDTKKYIRKIVERFDYNIMTIEEAEGMKFDVVIGNPPYQNANNRAQNNKLWFDFSLKSMEMTKDFISFVTPNAAFKDVDSNGIRLREELQRQGYGLVDFSNHKFEVFNVGVETCHWIVSKNADKPVTDVVFSHTNPIAKSICDKVVAFEKKLPLTVHNGHFARGDLKEEGKNKILFSGDKAMFTEEYVEGQGQTKLVFPFSASYHKMFLTEEATGMLNLVLPIDNKQEAKEIIDYALSPLFKVVASNYRKTSGFTPFVKNKMIPDLRGMTNQSLYDIFNLTQEEINYVEQNS